MDILRLGIASKKTIDKWHLGDCLAFMINGFYISFFVVCKQHTLTEIGAFFLHENFIKMPKWWHFVKIIYKLNNYKLSL